MRPSPGEPRSVCPCLAANPRNQFASLPHNWLFKINSFPNGILRVKKLFARALMRAIFFSDFSDLFLVGIF